MTARTLSLPHSIGGWFVIGLFVLLVHAPSAAAQCAAQVSLSTAGEMVTIHATGTASPPSLHVREILFYLNGQLIGSPPCLGGGTTCTHTWYVGTGCLRDGSYTVKAVADCGGTSGEATTGFTLAAPPVVQITNDGVDIEGDTGGLIVYDFKRGRGNVTWRIKTPNGESLSSPVNSDLAGSYPWGALTSCWPAGSYEVTARVARCSGEEATAESAIVVPPHTPTVGLSLLPGDNTRALLTWNFPQTSHDAQRKLGVVLEPSGTLVYQNGLFVARTGQDVIHVPACTFGSEYLRAWARACNDEETGLAEAGPMMLPKCETKSCPVGQPPNSVGDPVHVTSANMRLTDGDPIPGGLVGPLRRTYDSRRTVGTFGRGWTSIFDARLVANGMRDVFDRVDVFTENAERFLFVREAGSYRQIWPVPDRARGSLVLEPSGDILHREAGSSMVRVFRGGKLVALRNAGTGHEVAIAYDANGRPTTVADSWGSWSWTVATNGTTGRITSIAVVGHPELQWTYAIDGNGYLTGVSTPAGTWRTYTYSSGRMQTARDGAGHLIESHVYDGAGQALTSSGNNGEITNIAYDLPGREPGEWRTRVTYAGGRTTDFYSRHIAGQMRTVQIDGSCDCGSEDGVYAYDAAGHVFREQDALGYVRERQYVQDRLTGETTHLRPESCDPETDLDRCRLTPATLASDALILIATDATRTVSYEYADANWPDRVTRTTTESVLQPGGVRQETFTYDALSGFMTSQSVTGWTDSPARQEAQTTTTALHNGTEGAPFDPGAWFPQAWRTLPQPPKQRKSIDGPRPGNGDTTTFVYYPIDPSVPATWRGRLAASRNAAGHVTRFESYDVFGNAIRIVDPNGVATEMTYDSLGRLLTTTLEGVPGCDTVADPLCATDVTTTRVYSGNGPLANEVHGDAVTNYTYDGRGRVLAISRGPSLADLRERIETTYDPVTALKTLERVLGFENGSWAEKKRETYGYNTSDQLTRITHPDGTSVEYIYGPGSRLLAIRDENHTEPNTFYDYDPAGRLQKVTQTLSTALGGAIHTRYEYDRDGNLASVTDPNGNETTYRYDDFGRMIEQVSPVTGVTRYQYDAAGNLLLTTLPDGSVTTRAYDSVGRVSSATSTRDERSETVTWTYDVGSFGKGRLTSMTDPTGATAYTYDRRGLLLSESKSIGSAVYTTAFGYDADGNRSRIRYPGGRIVDTTFDFASRPVAATTEGTPLVLSASYLPFGPLREIVFGNGTTRTTTYDPRYRPITNMLTGPLLSGEDEPTTGVLASYEYTHDPAGNITRIADLADSAYDRDFGYDDLHRLTTANGGEGQGGRRLVRLRRHGQPALDFGRRKPAHLHDVRHDAQDRLGDEQRPGRRRRLRPGRKRDRRRRAHV